MKPARTWKDRLYDPRIRGWVSQAVVFLGVAGFFLWIGGNTASNLERQGIASGFDFLGETSGFDMTMSLIPYDESSSYGTAFLASVVNTLLVSIIGVFLATILGFVIGIARLSKNWLLAKLAEAYIEIIRNVPLLLQLFFWYFAVLRALPGPRASLSAFDAIFLNIRGLYVPKPIFENGFHWEIPVLSGFNFQGGLVLIPELLSLVFALTIYTASFIAEIVRAGIMAVPKGQSEASLSLGLNRMQTLKLVVIPQALRVIIPPLTSQYLNLTKNSSLAAAIAYPDLVLVFAGTVLMQTGQAVEVILMTMSVYLFISLSISIGMNLYNRKMALVER